MSTKTRTGPEVKPGKDAFGEGVGLAHQVGLALGNYDVTRAQLNQISADPIRAMRVAAVIKGEVVSTLTLDALVAREQQLTRDFCALAQIECPKDRTIEEGLVKTQKVWGSVTEHDRFVPPGVGLSEGFQFHYGWNAAQQAEGLQGLKLGHEANAEWWRTDRQVEHLPTVAGVIRCNFATVMQWTDLTGRPFNLPREKQVAWGKEQGGDGITTAEQNAYLNARSLMEWRSLPLISLGSLRCQNRYGSEHSLLVRCFAGIGFYVGHWGDGGEHWRLGALPGKFLALRD